MNLSPDSHLTVLDLFCKSMIQLCDILPLGQPYHQQLASQLSSYFFAQLPIYGHLPLLITIIVFPNFKPHNLSYYDQTHINQHQDCENQLNIIFFKNNGGHLGNGHCGSPCWIFKIKNPIFSFRVVKKHMN